MKVIVKLQDLVDEIEIQSDESASFLNVKTGDFVFMQNDYLRKAEDGEPFDDLLAWEQEVMEEAYDIVENRVNYIDLPSQYEINEYDMMERFCYGQKDSDIEDELLYAIRGKGAFRRFKDKVIVLGIEDEWYMYRDECYKEIARSFCERNKINYKE